jgi:hypothetical protein
MEYNFTKRESTEPLTLADLEAMDIDTVFQWGEAYIEHPWFNDAKPVSEGGNLEPDGRSVKVQYVVLRGGIADWKIYHSLDANLEPDQYLGGNTHLAMPIELVLKHGAGLHREDLIRKIVPCTDEAFERYRH